MKKLIIHGDPGLRKGGRIEYEDEEYEVFTVSRHRDCHPGPATARCTRLGGRRRDVQDPGIHSEHLDTDDIEAEAVTVLAIARRRTPSAEVAGSVTDELEFAKSTPLHIRSIPVGPGRS